MTKNKIKKGKIILNVCTIIAIVLAIAGYIVNDTYTQNIKNNLQGTDKLMYEMGVYKFPTSDVAVYLILGGVLILFIGSITSSIMCKCENCGRTVVSRHGSLYEHCPKCGKKVELD